MSNVDVWALISAACGCVGIGVGYALVIEDYPVTAIAVFILAGAAWALAFHLVGVF
jgi:hypothetical protein